jgi:RHS repeat-associated protein
MYDTAGRLIREVFDHYDDALDQTSEWIYDLVGNRTLQKLDKGNDKIFDAITTYNYDVNDRLLKELTNNKTTIYGFDNTQQTSKKVSENGTIVSETTFEYDLQGRMTVVIMTTASGTEKITYGYDSNGIRVSAIHEANGTITKTEYLNDSQSLTGYSQVLRQTVFDTEGNIIKTISYVIGHQRISQVVIENGTEQEYYFTFDGHGSTRALLGFTGAIIQLYGFDAYGNALGFDPNQALTEFLYSGEQFDSKIGQQYLRARFYDPATGRFNRLDPFFGNLNDPLSLNKYLYCHANPVNGIDPSGMMSMASVSIACAIGGSLTGIAVGGYIGYSQTGQIFSGKTIGYAILGGLVGFSVGSVMGSMIGYIAGASSGMNATTVFLTSIKMAPKLLQQVSKAFVQHSLGSQGSASLWAFGGGIIAGIVFALTEPDSLEEPVSIVTLTALGVSGTSDVGWRSIMKYACKIKYHNVPPAFQIFQVFTWGFNLGYFGTNWANDVTNLTLDTYDYFVTE